MFLHVRMRLPTGPISTGRGAPHRRYRFGFGFALVAGLFSLLLLLHGAAQAANGDPTLSIPTATVNVLNSSSFAVPVSFADAADPNEISSLAFVLDFDESCLTFDGVTDANEDGLPDAVTGLPAGYAATVTYNPANTDGEIAVSISDQEAPITALDDGVLATFAFGIQTSCRTTDGTQPAVNFLFGSPAPTFGRVDGPAVLGGTHTTGVYTLRFNAHPTDIALTATTVAENVALGTTVGAFSSTDLDDDLNDTHTYSLVSGAGSTDNSAFVIDGAALKTNTALNYELKNSYSIRVRTTDSYGGAFEKNFTITVTDVNEAPTSLSISSSSVAENAASGTTVGAFSSIDPDAGATASYSLVAGVGDTDNASFAIDGSALQTAAVFDFETKNLYTIRVRVTDNGDPGLTFDNIFTIRVLDVNDAPVAVDDVVDPDVQVIWLPTELFVLTNDTDEDYGDVLAVASVGTPNSGTALTTTTSINYTPAGDFNGVVTFPYTVRDVHEVGSLTDTGDVTLTVVANDPRGDCNADGEVNAGDFTAIVLELFDTDAEGDKWYEIYQEGYPGSPRGCDANASQSVTVADLTCTILVAFGDSSCTTGAVAAASSVAAELTVGQALVGAPNGVVDVPIVLATNGQRIAAASFALSFDQGQLALDVASAITFHTPPGMVTMANYNEAESRLEVAIYAVAIPMPTLEDGPVMTVKLRVNDQAPGTEIPLTLVLSSLGNDQGQAVPLEVNHSSVSVVQLDYTVFMPLLRR
ncbi:MAG: cadherin domain-containing protein [Caldilineaceae bacterium]|nr:cadherin domain-containing protein [Caldilineaceae bacterium]